MGWLFDRLKVKIDGYIIIDNFFSDVICTYLREKCLYSKQYTKVYWDYKALDFDNGYSTESLKEISEQYVVPKISLVDSSKYMRSWSFVYDNIARGVLPHADPSFINVNIWVTPDECVEDYNKNGLVIFKKKADKITWDQYNTDSEFIERYLKGTKYDRIPYKYNRAVIFRGNTFHATDHVHMKPGGENKRINYTFLYK